MNTDKLLDGAIPYYELYEAGFRAPKGTKGRMSHIIDCHVVSYVEIAQGLYIFDYKTPFDAPPDARVIPDNDDTENEDQGLADRLQSYLRGDWEQSR